MPQQLYVGPDDTAVGEDAFQPPPLVDHKVGDLVVHADQEQDTYGVVVDSTRMCCLIVPGELNDIRIRVLAGYQCNGRPSSRRQKAGGVDSQTKT